MTITSDRQSTRSSDRPRSQVWNGTRTIGTDLPADEVIDALADQDVSAWWCLPRDATALARTADLLGLDHFAVDDVLADREAPKVDMIKDTLIVVSAAVTFPIDDAALSIDRVSILATRRALVVIADDGPTPALIAHLQDCETRMRSEGIAAAVHVVLEALVRSYSEALQAIEEAAEDLTSALFDDKPMVRADQLQAFRLRQAIARLRKVVVPMMEVTAELNNAAAADDDSGVEDPLAALLAGKATARRFDDLSDHARHAADATTGVRDLLTSAFETNLALSDVHLNMVMKKLSAWAAIIAVPTLITGFMGMNVPYPGFSQTSGFVVAVILIVGAVTTLFLLFKRNDWL